MQTLSSRQPQTWDCSHKRGVCRVRSESGVELQLLEDPELEQEGPWALGKGEDSGHPARPFSLLSLASSERVRGRPQGGCVGHGPVLELQLEAMPGEEPSKRESHMGSPRTETRRARISVTASMSSAGSIAAGKGGRGSVRGALEP